MNNIIPYSTYTRKYVRHFLEAFAGKPRVRVRDGKIVSECKHENLDEPDISNNSIKCLDCGYENFGPFNVVNG